MRYPILQSVFDRALGALRQQGAPSILNDPYSPGSSSCLYRGPDGAKCALGHLIPDNLYLDAFETAGPYSRETGKAIVAATGLDPEDDEEVRFADLLQRCHDAPAMDELLSGEAWLLAFENNMRNLALRYNLSYSPPKARVI